SSRGVGSPVSSVASAPVDSAGTVDDVVDPDEVVSAYPVDDTESPVVEIVALDVDPSSGFETSGSKQPTNNAPAPRSPKTRRRDTEALADETGIRRKLPQFSATEDPDPTHRIGTPSYPPRCPATSACERRATLLAGEHANRATGEARSSAHPAVWRRHAGRRARPSTRNDAVPSPLFHRVLRFTADRARTPSSSPELLLGGTRSSGSSRELV